MRTSSRLNRNRLESGHATTRRPNRPLSLLPSKGIPSTLIEALKEHKERMQTPEFWLAYANSYENADSLSSDFNANTLKAKRKTITAFGNEKYVVFSSGNTIRKELCTDFISTIQPRPWKYDQSGLRTRGFHLLRSRPSYVDNGRRIFRVDALTRLLFHEYHASASPTTQGM